MTPSHASTRTRTLWTALTPIRYPASLFPRARGIVVPVQIIISHLAKRSLCNTTKLALRLLLRVPLGLHPHRCRWFQLHDQISHFLVGLPYTCVWRTFCRYECPPIPFAFGWSLLFFHAFLHIPFFKFIPIPSTFRPEFSFHGILHSTFSLLRWFIYATFPSTLFTDTFVPQLPSFRLWSSIFVIFHFLFPLHPCYLLATFNLVILRLRSFVTPHFLHSTTSLVSIQCITCTPFLYFRYSCPWMALSFVVYVDPM